MSLSFDCTTFNGHQNERLAPGNAFDEEVMPMECIGGLLLRELWRTLKDRKFQRKIPTGLGDSNKGAGQT